jgi:hypothetical protein
MQKWVNLRAKIEQLKFGGLKSSNWKTQGAKIKQLKLEGHKSHNFKTWRAKTTSKSIFYLSKTVRWINSHTLNVKYVVGCPKFLNHDFFKNITYQLCYT